jgi:hypothetical protein
VAGLKHTADTEYSDIGLFVCLFVCLECIVFGGCIMTPLVVMIKLTHNMTVQGTTKMTNAL